jgi:opacity protein-like surface antigen
MRNAVFILAIMLSASTLRAQDWAVGIGTGPFVFGDLASRTATISNGESTVKTESILSADTRVGVVGDVERFFNDRLSARLEGTFTRSPLSVKSRSGDSNTVRLNVGDLNVSTYALSLVYRFNRTGTFRPYVMAGPAYVLYDISRDDSTGAIPVFEGARGRWAVNAGGGLEWWLSRNLAVRGELADIYSESPLEQSDFPTGKVTTERPHHVHTSIGATWRF